MRDYASSIMLPQASPPYRSDSAYAGLKGLLALGICLLGGCANLPRDRTPVAQFPTMDCSALNAELEQSRFSLGEALHARRNAWKVVLPVVAAVRYGHAASRAREAEERIETLEAEMHAKGCAIPPLPAELDFVKEAVPGNDGTTGDAP